MEHENPSRIVSEPEKRIPKYCTNVSLAKLKNGLIIMTFLEHDEAIQPETADQGVIIERIVVDEQHAKQILEKLSNILKN